MKCSIFEYHLVIDIFFIYLKITLTWMPHDKSTLIQRISWCCQARWGRLSMKCCLTGMEIPMLHIRWSRNCLIFNMGILIHHLKAIMSKNGFFTKIFSIKAKSNNGRIYKASSDINQPNLRFSGKHIWGPDFLEVVAMATNVNGSYQEDFYGSTWHWRQKNILEVLGVGIVYFLRTK